MRLTKPALTAAVLVAVVLTGCSESSPESASGSGHGASGNTVGCDFPTTGREPAKEVTPPPPQAAKEGPVAVTLQTSVGEIGATLDSEHAPCTVASFVSLAEQGWFDDSRCHRLTTAQIHVLQCGDPTGTGTGGPGYTVPDELTGKETYPAGTIAMANTGQPDTGGSQFFLVHQETPLPPQYTVFGQVDDAGLEVLRRVADKGTTTGGPDGPPEQEVVIEGVRLPA